MSTTPWTWDPSRQEYYIFVPAENAWVFADGTRISLEQPAAVPRPEYSASLSNAFDSLSVSDEPDTRRQGNMFPNQCAAIVVATNAEY